MRLDNISKSISFWSVLPRSSFSDLKHCSYHDVSHHHINAHFQKLFLHWLGGLNTCTRAHTPLRLFRLIPYSFDFAHHKCQIAWKQTVTRLPIAPSVNDQTAWVDLHARYMTENACVYTGACWEPHLNRTTQTQHNMAHFNTDRKSTRLNSSHL